MMGGEGCWCRFINNKFFTFRKVYFLLKEDVEARAMARVQTVKGTAAKDLYII